MNRTKILFFCAGAVLAALLVWWLSAGERTPAGESGKRSPLDVIMTRTSIRAYRDCPVGADTVELLLRAAMAAPSAVNRQRCPLRRWPPGHPWPWSSAATCRAIRGLPATGG